MWDETISQCGPNEVRSCLYTHLGTQSIPLNPYIQTFYVAVWNLPIESIELIFLTKGHTQNENDSLHSRIECAKKDTTVYAPGEWISLAERACKVRPYIVKWQSQENFYNFHEDLGGVYATLDNKKVTDVNDNKRVTVKWAEIKMIRFEKNNPCKMLFKYRLLEPFQCVTVGHKPNSTRSSSTNTITLNRLYNAPLPISQKNMTV